MCFQSKGHKVRQEYNVKDTQPYLLKKCFWATSTEGASDSHLPFQTLKTKNCCNCLYVIMIKTCMCILSVLT